VATIFFTPPGYSGSAELSASTGLEIIDQGHWRFSQAGYNDGATFGLGLGWPNHGYNGEYTYGAPPPNRQPLSGGLLHLTATDWPIAVVGNQLTDYTDPDTSITYTASQCQIIVRGQWQVTRQQNSNSFNSIGVLYDGLTETDQGGRPMNPWLLSYSSGFVTYVIQGADVQGGAQDTFSTQEFYCRVTELATSNNSNYEFQSNSVTRPVWVYTYSKRYEITV
jgi:hypothetical protein